MFSSLQLNRGGQVKFRLSERSDSSPTFKVFDSSGSELESGTATLHTANTTAAAAISKGDTSFTVSDASGIVPGLVLAIDGSDQSTGESVIVSYVVGTTVNIYAPFVFSHSIGCAVKCNSAFAAISAASCSEPQWLRVELTYTVSAQERPVASVSAEVTRYHVQSNLTHADLLAVDPSYRKRAHAGTPWQYLFEISFERLVAMVSANGSAGSIVGWLDLTQAHAIMVLLMIAQQSTGDEASQRELALSARLKELVNALLTTRPIDSNQDGAIQKNEQFYTSIPLIRG